MKRLAAVGLAAGLATAGLAVFGSAADATITVGAINCSSATLLGPVAIRNPSVSHVTGPIWADTGSAATITNEAGLTVLPSTVGPATIGSYQDLVNKSQIVGIAGATPALSTIVTTGAIAGLNFLYDPDLADNGGVPNPVPMNGVATYGALGPFAAPTVVVNPPLPLVGVNGTFEVVTTLDPGAGNLPVQGSIGGGIFTPDVPISITNVGPVDGVIDSVATSTTLTANVTAPIATSAVTTCAPGAAPNHTINVQTDGAAITARHPVIACKPAPGTGGIFKDSKGWWSGDTNPLTVENYGGSLGGSTTWGGCRAPDQRLQAWTTAKFGALATDAVQLQGATISVKGKHFGNCTNVDELTAAGQAHAADSSQAYEIQGTVATKYLTALPPVAVANKVKGSTISGAIRLVLDSTQATAVPAARFEAKGVVTKGTGIGGTGSWTAELDNSQAPILAIIGCNAPGYSPPAVGIFRGNTAPYLNLLTGVDAALVINAP